MCPFSNERFNNSSVSPIEISTSIYVSEMAGHDRSKYLLETESVRPWEISDDARNGFFVSRNFGVRFRFSFRKDSLSFEIL